MLIDFHTHNGEPAANIKKQFNIIIPVEEEENIPVPGPGVYSAGIHPWYISGAQNTLQLERLRTLLKYEQVRTVGECGLDKLRGAPLPLQEEIFMKQLRMAEEFRKPLILHIVKAFGELLSIIKIVRPKVPLIIHGFNKNPETASRLLAKGCYLSLGAALLKDGSPAQEVLRTADPERIFLETDDSEADIREIYHKAASILGIGVPELETRIEENYYALY